MKLRLLTPLAFLLLALSACEAPSHKTITALTQPTTATSTFINVKAIIIVRHADIDIAKKKTMGNAAPLLNRGQARAKELAYALKDAGITRIVTTEALRTQQTAAVLAKELNLTPETPLTHAEPFMASGNPQKKEQSDVLAYLAQNVKPNETILLVHHHSVIPSLLKDLGYSGEPQFTDDSEFDRLYLILPNPATHTYKILRLRYGGNWHQE